jgi:hypothetical protein
LEQRERNGKLIAPAALPQSSARIQTEAAAASLRNPKSDPLPGGKKAKPEHPEKPAPNPPAPKPKPAPKAPVNHPPVAGLKYALPTMPMITFEPDRDGGLDVYFCPQGIRAHRQTKTRLGRIGVRKLRARDPEAIRIQIEDWKIKKGIKE